MKRLINTSQTFRAIRQLPLEISYKQVEAWIRSQQIESRPLSLLNKLKHWWKHWWQ